MSPDAIHVLSRPRSERYELWFEFLKTALRDPNVTVDRSIYALWGDVENSSFSSWWDAHWRELFAVRKREASVLHTPDECSAALADSACVIVQIPLANRSMVRTKDIKAAIDTALKLNPRAKLSKPKAMFEIDAKRSMNLSAMRAILRLYQLYLDNDRNLEKAAVLYYKWATDRNEMITRLGYGRHPPPQAFVPSFLRAYVEVLQKAKEAGGKRSSSRALLASGTSAQSYDILRAKTRRYIRQAEKIAKNVGRGVFPGRFQ